MAVSVSYAIVVGSKAIEAATAARLSWNTRRQRYFGWAARPSPVHLEELGYLALPEREVIARLVGEGNRGLRRNRRHPRDKDETIESHSASRVTYVIRKRAPQLDRKPEGRLAQTSSGEQLAMNSVGQYGLTLADGVT